MTPEQRAVQLWCSPEKANTPLDIEFCKAIADQIRQAEQEAYERGFAEGEFVGRSNASVEQTDHAYQEGFRDAIENAAKVAESRVFMPLLWDQIRQLKP